MGNNLETRPSDHRRSGRARGRAATITALTSAVLGLGLGERSSFAEEGTWDETQFSTHGFVSQGYIKTTENEYLAHTSDLGSFEFSEAGVNLTAQVNDRFRIGAQLFARDLGPIGDYSVKFDWYSLDYRFADWLGVRAGRTKLPFGLYNETSDVDAARVPILLPQSVYPTQNREYLLAQTGAELYGYLPVGWLGALEYRLYGGTVFLEPGENPELTSFNVPYVVGGRLMWQNLVEGLQFGASLQALRFDGTFVPSAETLAALQMQGQMLPADFDGTIEVEIPIGLGVASVEYAVQGLVLSAEYSRWVARAESSVPELIAEVRAVNERYYVMASYQVAPWFTPGLYYAAIYPQASKRSGRDAYQHDVAASFRYDLTANWLLKLEGHYMRGTAGLDSGLNGGTPSSKLAPTWGAFLLKTTAYF